MGQETIIFGHPMSQARRQQPITAGFDQFRGIYQRRIPTYSFPLMIQVMTEFGVEPASILKNTGLDVEDLAQDGTLISFLQAYKFVRNLLRESPFDDIGLRIGDRYQISTFGVLGYAMMSCANWAEALILGSRFSRVASSLVHLDLEMDEANRRLRYLGTPFYPDLEEIEAFTIEKLFSSLVAVTRPLLVSPAYPVNVELAYQAPAYAQAYSDYFHCPVHFGAHRNCFELDLDQLQQPLAAANSVSAEMGRSLCEQAMERYQQPRGPMHRQVADQLLAAPGQFPSMEQVAGQLGISSRTLRRQLEAEGQCFRDISDQVRHDLAKRYLQRSQLNLEEIAALLGFTESTNFRRAFRRWEGVAPARYRRELKIA